jgi:YVTN family beta-propeller protein
VEFRLLGPVEVVVNGTPLPIGGHKQRALLAILLLRANEVVTRDALIDTLWGEKPPATASDSINVYISRLRKLLAASECETQVVTRGHGYSLDLGDDFDLRRFEQLVGKAREIAPDGDAASARTVLDEALGLWRGPALADLEEPFAREERGRLEELRLRALEERLELDLELARHADIVPELEALVAEHPYREPLCRQLMLALYGSGRQAEALALYRNTRRTFADELGIEPGPELRQLEQSILRQDPFVVPVRERTLAAGREGAGRGRRAADTRPRMRLGLIAAVAVVAIVAATALAFSFVGHSHRLTAIRPNAVGVVDPRSGALVAEVPVGAQFGVSGFEHGGSATVGFGSVWVAGSESRTISRIDMRTHMMEPLGVPSEALDVTAGMGAIWVTHRFAGISKLDPRDETVPETFTLRASDGTTYSLERIAVGAGAVWIVAAKGDQIHLLKLDAASHQVKSDRALGIRSANDLVVGDDAVWITSTLANRVFRVGRDGRLIGAPVVIAGPTSIAVGAGAVWVTSEVDNSVWRIDPETNLITDQIRVGRRPVDVAVGAGGVWVANALDGTLSRIDVRSREVVATIPVARTLGAVVVGRGHVWAVSTGTK